MSRNPHPLAGQPTYEGAEVGYQYECIPCVVKTRNRVGRDMRKAQAEAARLRRIVLRLRGNALDAAVDAGVSAVFARYQGDTWREQALRDVVATIVGGGS